MRILGIDYGDSRIGIAISDPFGWTAQGIETIHYKGNLDEATKRIKQIIEQYQVNKIVVGFPINMNGTIGDRGQKPEKFIKIIKDIYNIDVIKWDERLTTISAAKTMIDLNINKKKKKNLIDTISAVYILQGYLDSIKNIKN